MNTDETDHKDSMATDQTPNGDILKIQGHGSVNVNTEKSPNNCDEPTTSTPKTHNQKVTKDEWSSLMFSSDDSLFEEMTKQLEDDTIRTKTDKKASPSATCKIAAASTSTKDQETLPDIVHTSSRTVAAAGLLMLGADPKDVDAEIDNEVVMPITNKCNRVKTILVQVTITTKKTDKINERRRNEIVIQETLPEGQPVKQINRSQLHLKLLQPPVSSQVHQQVPDLPGEY